MGSPIDAVMDALENPPEGTGVDRIPWMPTPGIGPGSDILTNPKVTEILEVLSGSPLLVEPTLRFVRLKQAQIAQASLEVLYSEEELDALKEALKDEDPK